MITVVLDTNVVVSAALSTDGNPALIFNMLIRGDIESFTSAEIIAEIREIFERHRIAERLPPL